MFFNKAGNPITAIVKDGTHADIFIISKNGTVYHSAIVNGIFVPFDAVRPAEKDNWSCSGQRMARFEPSSGICCWWNTDNGGRPIQRITLDTTRGWEPKWHKIQDAAPYGDLAVLNNAIFASLSTFGGDSFWTDWRPEPPGLKVIPNLVILTAEHRAWRNNIVSLAYVGADNNVWLNYFGQRSLMEEEDTYYLYRRSKYRLDWV